MDPVIQGLTQSAIVQKLSETEHAVKRFTPDLPDNAPYRSISKRVVQPFRGTNSGPNSPSSTLDFRVPRNGFLTKAHLRCKVDFGGDRPIATLPNHAQSFYPRLNFFANFFLRATLSIDGKDIETLYPEQIMSNAFELNGPESERVLKGLRGLLSSTPFGDRGDDVYDLEVIQGSKFRCGVFFIPLDFSAFKFHKDALDANFLGRIEIRVEKRPFLFSQAEINESTSVDLVCKFYNVHEHFRTQIRNGMHGNETQTKLISNGYKLNVVPSIHESGLSHTYDLSGVNLFVTDILMSFRKSKGAIRGVEFYQHDFRIRLRANDRILFDKKHSEIRSEMLGVSSSYVSDDVSMARSTKHFMLDNPRYEVLNTSLDLPPERLLGNDALGFYDYASSMFRIPLKHVNTDEFLSGGLDLSSLANVELIIDSHGFISDYDHVDIILKHKNMLRIDSKTGSVSL